MNKIFNDKSKKFLKKEGFYIALIICLMVIGVYAAITVSKKSSELANSKTNSSKAVLETADSGMQNSVEVKNDKASEDTKDNEVSQGTTDSETSQGTTDSEKVSNESSEVNQTVDSTVANGSTNAVEETSNNTQEASSNVSNAITTPVTDNSDATVSSNASIKFMNPCDGPIVSSFSTQTVYCKTIGTYKVSNGIGIKASVGTEVLAIADGKIKEIDNDKTDLGSYIIIDNGNGFKSYYGNLDENIKFKVGDPISEGMVIGKVGQTRGNYLNEDYGSHLYFAIEKSDQFIDPAKYITNTVDK